MNMRVMFEYAGKQIHPDVMASGCVCEAAHHTGGDVEDTGKTGMRA